MASYTDEYANANIDPWCEPDDCPASICNGPHIEHACGDSIVTARFDNSEPCPFCGKPLNDGAPVWPEG